MFAAPGFFEDGEKAAQISKRYKDNQKRTEILMDRWGELEDELSAIEAQCE